MPGDFIAHSGLDEFGGDHEPRAALRGYAAALCPGLLCEGPSGRQGKVKTHGVSVLADPRKSIPPETATDQIKEERFGNEEQLLASVTIRG